MRSLAFVAALALVPSIATGRTLDVPTFADIRWGAPGADVIKAATEVGLQMVSQDEDGDYRFSGELFGAPAVVHAFMSPTSGLVKVEVRLATPEDKPISKYAEVVDSLTVKYGKTEQVGLFNTPYAWGDGLEEEAVRAGKGLLLSAWGDDRRPGQAVLFVRVTRLVVGMNYESHDWAAELDRRKQQSPSWGPRVAALCPLTPDDVAATRG